MKNAGKWSEACHYAVFVMLISAMPLACVSGLYTSPCKKHQNDVGIPSISPEFSRSEFMGRLLGLDSTPQESWLRAISGETTGFAGL